MNSSFLGLLAGAHGILFSLALIVSGWRQKQTRFALGIVLFVFSIELLNAGVMPFGYHKRPDAIPFWLLGSYLWIPPALALFLRAIATPGYSMPRRHAWLFLPALIEIVTEAINFIAWKTGKGWPLQSSIAWTLFTEFLPLVWTLALLFRRTILVIQAWRMPATFSVYQRRQAAFLLLFLVFTLLWVADTCLVWPVFPVIQVLLCCILFGLGYIIYFRPAFFEAPAAPQPARAVAPAYAQYNDGEQWSRLQQLFQTQHSHRQPRLTLEEVATELGLPARYLSTLINQQAQTNFNHFVNTWRVEEVVQRMQDPQEQNKTLLGMALDAGFNSKSSFNQIFKSVTGETPSACFKRLNKQ